MPVRAYVANVQHEFDGLNVRYRWTTYFVGPEVNANPPHKYDGDIGEFLRTPDMNDQACRAAIRDAIQERSTTLGYGTLETQPELIDAVFSKL